MFFIHYVLYNINLTVCSILRRSGVLHNKSLSLCFNISVTRAKTAFIRIDRSLKNVPNNSLNIFLNEFDTQINSMLLFGE